MSTRLATYVFAILAWFAFAGPAQAANLAADLSGTEQLRRANEQMVWPLEKAVATREALDALRREAQSGDAKAQYNLARLYETGIPDGKGGKRFFPDRAWGWYMIAAQQGHKLAQKRLGQPTD